MNQDIAGSSTRLLGPIIKAAMDSRGSLLAVATWYYLKYLIRSTRDKAPKSFNLKALYPCKVAKTGSLSVVEG